MDDPNMHAYCEDGPTDAEKPELCQKHLQRCPEPRTVDCCGVVDEHDIVECSRCGKQWTVPCSFDEDYS